MATQFTPNQLTTLKAAILAETDPAFVQSRAVGDATGMAKFYNAAHATQKAWNKVASWAGVFNAIDGAKYTPTTGNVAAATDATATKQLLVNLIKLQVQQNMLLAFNSVDARDSGNVDALLDTVTAVYTLSGNNTVSPGGASGVNVANQLTRPATKGEVVFGGNDVTKATVTAKVLAWEGSVTADDISAAQAA